MKIESLLDILFFTYPSARCELVFSTPLELLVATILSAQCTDIRVNKVTPHLFSRCKNAYDYSSIKQLDLEKIIYSIGFYRKKANALRGMGKVLVEKFQGKVPENLEELLLLPGVGRKTALVLLGNAFNQSEGIVVDTHVTRISQRIGLTKEKNPIKIEKDLMKFVPKKYWILISHCLIFHGRYCCKAIKPICHECQLQSICYFYQNSKHKH